MIHIEEVFVIRRLIKAVIIFFRYSTLLKLGNLLRVECERAFKRQIIHGRPYFIKMQPANICNSGCKYCLRSEKRNSLPIGEMSLADCKKTIDKLKRYAYLIGFQYYGEPLCNDSIFEMIDYAHRCNIGTYLSTNLQDLKKDDYDRLITCGLDLLTVSIDGITEETYKKYREKGSLAAVLFNIKGLIKAKKRINKSLPFIALQFIVMKHNQHEIEGARRLAKELGVNNIEFKPVGTTDDSILPDNEKLYRRVYAKNIKLKRKSCWWLWGALIVLWDGKVIPCCHIVINKTELNIFSDDIVSIINNPFNQKIREIGGYKAISDDNPCRDCVIPYGSMLQQTL